MKNRISYYLHYYYQPVFIFLIMLIVSSFFSTIGVDAHHDGILFKPAVDVAEGKILFKESFSQYGALTTLLQALAIRIFGEYLIVIRLLTAFFYALTSFFLWLVWSRIIPKWLTTISCLIWIFLAPFYFHSPYKYDWPFLPWSSVYALFFLILSCYFVILYIEKNSLLFIFFAGVSSALTFWCRQPIGIFLSASLILYLVILNLFLRKTKLIYNLKSMLMFVLGIIITMFGFISWLVLNGALYDWWLQQIYFAFLFATKITQGQGFIITNVLNNLFAISKLENVTYIWTVFPIICLLFICKLLISLLYNNYCLKHSISNDKNINIFTKIRVIMSPVDIKKKRKVKAKNKTNTDEEKISIKEIVLSALLFTSIASWMQYYPVPCTRHLYWSAAPMIGIFTYFIWSMLNKQKTLLKTLITLLVLLSFFGYDTGYRIKEGLDKLNKNYVQVSAPNVLRGMRLSESQANYYNEVAKIIDEYLHKHPERGLISIGKDAIYLTFQKNNNNFHPLYVYWDDVVPLYPDYLQSLDRYIKENKPLILSQRYSYEGYISIKDLNYDSTYISILVPYDE